MNMRTWNVFAAAALIAALTAGCSSSSNPTPSPTGTALAADRLVDATALIVQCALTRGLMKPPTGLNIPPGMTPFVKGTKLVITSANSSTFNEWYAGIVGMTIAGQEIEDWVEETASSGKLPAAVCGTFVTASALQKQVFAGDPAAGDPWG
jgi:hypothetical protein